jgi:hypothetical protein
MSKRKDIKQSKSPERKKPKFEVQPSQNDLYYDMLAPLLEMGMLSLDGVSEDENEDYNNSPAITKFMASIGNNVGKSQLDLGQYIAQQLANFKYPPENLPNKALNNFNRLNIRTQKPQTPEENAKMKVGYDTIDRNISLNTYDDVNPLTYLIHEGTHALDDLYMRTPQQEAIDTLASIESKKRPPENILQNILVNDNQENNKRGWYDQVQEILNDDAFNTSYNKDWAKEQLKSDLSDMQQYQGGQEVENFRDVQKFLTTRGRKDNYENQFFQSPFHEMTAHAIENLDNPWNISNDQKKANYWHNNNDGRRLLKNITKGVYRNFQELDQEFSTKYPEANQSFLDRITQLRNYEKYHTAEEYLEKRGHTLKPGYKPSYAYNPANNVASRTPSPNYNLPVGTDLSSSPSSDYSSSYSRTPSPNSPNYNNPPIGGITSLYSSPSRGYSSSGGDYSNSSSDESEYI